MTHVEDFILHLRDINIKLWVEDGDLCCEAPPGVLTPDMQSQLKRRKEDILSFLTGKLVLDRHVEAIRPVPREGDIPLSFSQQRLWFLEQFEGRSPAYNESMGLRLTGPLKRGAMETALNEILRRHEVLRTAFAMRDGQPVQIISSEQRLPLSMTDLRVLPEERREAESGRLISKEAADLFDLSEAPLIRAALLRLGREEHILLITMHHIVTDGWSTGILAREIGTLYRAFSEGKLSPLPDLPVQYADFAVWQRERLTGEFLEKQLGFWKSQLAGTPPLLELPTDRPRPPVQTFEGGTQTFSVARGTTAALRDLSRESGVSLFMTLHAAFSTLLFRHSGYEDILVGTPIAGRNYKETEPLIGFLLNTLVLRTDLSGEPTFSDLLGRVRQVTLDAYEHQEVPFERLVDELRLERNLSHHPLFQVMFTMQNAPADFPDLPGLTLTPLEAGHDISKFDLSLDVWETPEGVAGSFEYNTDLFDHATITRMIGHFLTLLAGIASDPDQRISELPLLTEAERHQILWEWNDTDTEYPTDKCVHHLFEEQAERTPDAVAVVSENRQVTYSELNARANRLAHHLMSLGVGPEAPVGICMERCAEVIMGLLGILKAGGAYLPLDPEYPRERLAFMLADADVGVLMTQERLVPLLPTHEMLIVCPDRDAGTFGERDDNPVSTVRPENPAYVIYTSGSTGRPKGVAVGHRSLYDYVMTFVREFGIGSQDRLLCQTAVTFDASVEEIYPSLCTAARLAICRSSRDLNTLLSDILTHRITVLSLSPAAVGHLNTRADDLAGLRLLISGADILRPSHIDNLLGRTAICNTYGPTEATVCSTYHRIGHPPDAPPPIGRAIANTRLYIADTRLQLVPIGASGELGVAGAGLARGYLNRPDLTAERFVPDSLGSVPGARLYRTGDLCRHLPDGAIEFQGRTDHQVKIRGFRIELGEIGAAISEHPSVRENVVVARKAPSGDRQLIAYIVGDIGASELRDHLRRRLPDHMIPAHFVFMDALPLTSSGKVDRNALPEPDMSVMSEASYAAPQTQNEKILARIWEEVLRVGRVGIHENFFSLGGDSILSIRVVSRAAEAGLSLTVRQIFEHQTLFELAGAAAERTGIHADQGSVVGELPLTPIMREFLEPPCADPHHFNQSVLLAIPDSLSPGTLGRGLETLVRHHDALRMAFTKAGDGWHATCTAPSDAASLLETVDLSALPEDGRLPALDAHAAGVQAGLSLSDGMLLKAAHYKMGGTRTTDNGQQTTDNLLIVIHHLAVDGVSWRILLEDLETVCGQVAAGRPVKLPPKTTSFREWAMHLSEHADSKTLLSEKAHWLNICRDDVPHLPTDRPHDMSENTIASARTVSVSLDEEETDALLRDVPPVYRTQVNDILLTALAQAVGRHTGGGEVLFDLEGHGREELFDDIDISRTVGWFTSLFPVRLSLSHGDPGGLIKSVKEQLRSVPGRGVGYGILRNMASDTAIREPLEGMPRPGICFNYLGQFDETFSGSDLFSPAEAAAGSEHGPRRVRDHLIEVNGMVIHGKLDLGWTYSENIHDRETVERLAGDFMTALRGLIALCQSPEAGGMTPSDVPLADISQSLLDGLTREQGNVEDIYPLSPMQRGMLFHTLYDPRSGVYFEQICLTLETRLDEEAFRQAWQRVVDRHPILRTSIVSEGLEEPLQIVHRSVTLPWHDCDLRHLSLDGQRAESDRLREEDRDRGFDMARPPLMRCILIRTGEARYEFVLSFHHILADGWSTPIVFGEVTADYAARCQGEDTPLPHRRPYRDYIAWLRRQDTESAREFWRGEMAGFTAPTPLVTATSPGSLTNPEYDDASLTLSESLTSDMEGLARKARVTLSTVIRGAWAVLLNRYSAEGDIVFGATVSGRPASLAGAEEMVGLLINTVPVRVGISRETDVAALLDDLQAGQARCDDHIHIPLTDIQMQSDVPRGTPLFESILVFENYPTDESLGGLDDVLPVSRAWSVERTNYPLTLLTGPGRTLKLMMIYDRNRFDPAGIARMLNHLRLILGGMVADPAQKISELPLLTEAERHQVLHEWNDTKTAYPEGRCIHHLFEEQAERTPDAMAVVSEDRQVTYSELNVHANRLAHHLMSLGVAPDVPVGICVERCTEMVTGVLGILKAGGTYVPLDPAYPKDRLRFMIEESDMRVLLTQEKISESLPAHGAHVLLTDTAGNLTSRENGENPRTDVSVGNVAYVIYTSGSTGRPKGIAMGHLPLSNLISWQTGSPAFRGGLRTMQFASLNFDVSFQEMFSTWCSGGTLVLIPEGTRADPEALSELIRTESLGRIFLPPVVLRHLAPPCSELPSGSLREIITAGEQLSLTDDIRMLLRRAERCVLHNHYGPSETHVVTAFMLTDAPEACPVSPPIGRPVANVRTYVFDKRKRPVPAGVPGELHIGGACLARGYVGRPDLTSEKFVPDPFGSESGSRMYKTGDLCRHLPDGNIEFIGRADHQVKIRGFRIELGEIGAVLSGHPSVRDSVVIVREAPSGDRQLAAYVVGETGASELRDHLRNKLPDYMIPAHFVFMEALPLTPNGKIDRKALPDPDMSETREEHIPPRNPTEEAIASIWADVLGRERVGVRDDFFELGGHSLLATQVVSRLREAFQVEVPLRTLFEAPTVIALGEYIDTVCWADQSRETVDDITDEEEEDIIL